MIPLRLTPEWLASALQPKGDELKKLIGEMRAIAISAGAENGMDEATAKLCAAELAALSAGMEVVAAVMAMPGDFLVNTELELRGLHEAMKANFRSVMADVLKGSRVD